MTYAAVLARTLGRELPHPDRSVAFVHRHQRPDGRFVNLGGEMDPKSDLAVLYNTTQGVVALRALGATPKADPRPVLARFFDGDAYAKLPWYTTSFFPLALRGAGRALPGGSTGGPSPITWSGARRPTATWATTWRRPSTWPTSTG